MQKQLTDEQKGYCFTIAKLLGRAFSWQDTAEGKEYWSEVSHSIQQKAEHGTSDGKPGIKPSPPIIEGWRKAEPNEYERSDIKVWCSGTKQWIDRLSPGQEFLPFDHYIVPADQPLTDRDACVIPRLLVMVRNRDGDPWVGPCKYLGKTESWYAIEPENGDGLTAWKQARRATPGEIEAAAMK